MKATVKIFILFLAVNSVLLMTPQKAAAQVSISFQIFYDDLTPYGYWIDTPEYGYVWVPDVPSFIPYRTNGYWLFTNVGWTWVSNYSWGWAPFHYGRWYYDSYYGWIWVPGYEWGPGWVIWRQSEGFYGWAPIGPGISITIAYGRGYRLPYNYWTCVRDRDFGRTNIYNYYLPSSNNVTIINNSTVINNIQRDNSTQVSYNAGPNRTEVQSRTGRTISPVNLRERDRPGQNISNREFQIYRPRVEKNRATEREPAPSKVVRLKDVKPASQRNVRTQPQRESQPARQQEPQRQRNDQPARQQQPQQQRNNQQTKEQQPQQQRNDQPTRQQQPQQQSNNQQIKEQQPQQQRNEQSIRQQQSEQQAKEQQVRQQQMQQQAKEQQTKEQQQARQQQMQKQQNDSQAKQQRVKQK